MSSPATQAKIPGIGMLRETGNLFALGLDIVRGLFQRPFQLREFI